MAGEPEVETTDATSEQVDADPPRAPSLTDFFNLESDAPDDQIQSLVEQCISAVVEKTEDINNYNVLILYDGRRIDRSDANRIYRALSNVDRTRPTLLVLRSPGGDVAAAYFIGKLCREHTNCNFDVAVPREAKSAATLVLRHVKIVG